MFKSIVKKIKSIFSRKAKELNIVSEAVEEMINDRLERMEHVAEQIDASVFEVEKTVKKEVKKVEASVAKKKPAAKKADPNATPKPKGRPKKTQQ